MASLLERFLPGGGLRAQVADLSEQLGVQKDNNGLLQESIAQLQLALEDVGWVRALAAADTEFSRDGLRQMTAICRLYALKSPLIKRGLGLRQVYVHGQGVEITARANGKRGRSGEQDANTVIQDFLDDPDNRRTFTGADARTRNERSLGTDGNIFISLWTKPLTGSVQVRLLPWDEVDDVICNPQDSSEPWYYHRKWTERTLDVTSGGIVSEQREAYYPAIGYRPRTRPKRLGAVPVHWDAPVRHVRVNEMEGWKFGVPDAYAAIDWAKAYKDFLEDWAKLVRALSKFAWRTTAKGNTQAAAMKARFDTVNAATATNAVAGTAIMPEGVPLEAIPKTGATVDSDSGRPLAMMVASALGVPVTMLLADPGQTGARAVAETLDQPMRLEMSNRRELWSGVLRDICAYVVREAVRAPQGRLKGVVGRDEYDRETVTLAGDTEQTIDIVWPDLNDLSPDLIITAVVKAAESGTIPPEVIARLLLTALGIQHVDEIVDAMMDDDGRFLWPDAPPTGGGLGQQAADAFTAGDDPAEVGTGSMAPDGPEEDQENPDPLE